MLADSSFRSYVALGLFLGIIFFIVMLYVRRKRLERGVGEFRTRHQLASAATIPAGLHAALDASNWRAYTGQLSTPRGPLPYFWLEGFVSGSTMINGVPTRTISPLVGIALPAKMVDAKFDAKIAATQRRASWWGRNFQQNAQYPMRAERIEADGLFLLVWTVSINPAHYEKALAWVESALAEKAD